MFQQTNLVSDQPGVAQITDPNLVNPWGIALGPNGGTLWVSDNGTGLASLFRGGVNGSPFIQNPGLTEVNGLGAPTGQVFNSTSDFVIHAANGDSAPAFFIFVSEDGTITAWNPNVPKPAPSSQAQLAVDVPDAVFKGVAIASDGASNFLFATDFHNGQVDVFDKNFAPVAEAKGAFINFEQKVAGIKQRLNAPKFKEYFNQAQLFLNSLAPHEYDHLVGPFTFELSKCDDEIVTTNMIKRLNDIDFEFAKVSLPLLEVLPCFRCLLLDGGVECWCSGAGETCSPQSRQER